MEPHSYVIYVAMINASMPKPTSGQPKMSTSGFGATTLTATPVVNTASTPEIAGHHPNNHCHILPLLLQDPDTTATPKSN